MRSEAYSSSVVDCAAEAIIAIDPTQRLTLANRTAERLFDYAPGELLGQPTALVLPEWQERWSYAHHLPSPDDHHVERRQTIGRRREGSEFPVEVAISRMRVAGRQHLVAVVRDITARLRSEAALRESEERFHQAFSSAAVGMAIVSLDGRWLEVNTALCRQLGYDAAELQEMTFVDVTHPDDLEGDIELGTRLLRGEVPSYVREKRYLHRSGATIWVLLSASLVRDAGGTPLYFLVQVQDISERKAAEEELRRRSEELARSNTELEQYAYVASHDLQEPLRMVASYTELLAKRYGGQLDERADKWIGYAADGARRLQTLIADLLSLSHLGSTGAPLTAVDMNDVLERAMAPLEAALAESGGRVTREPLPEVAGDPAQLELVLRNLLSNAIKFR
ncbi:MAG TPA: PAS domain S-box protein, partial [Gemmatimonadaceae bacterium]|nr:PAS domain S-box protein [Gemmatimonadaceae bacterium]